MLSGKSWKLDALGRLVLNLWICVLVGSLLVSLVNFSIDTKKDNGFIYFSLFFGALSFLAAALVLLNKPWAPESYLHRLISLAVCCFGGVLLTALVQGFRTGPAAVSMLNIGIAMVSFQGAAIVSRVKDPGTIAGRGRGVAVVGAGAAPKSALTVYSLCVRGSIVSVRARDIVGSVCVTVYLSGESSCTKVIDPSPFELIASCRASSNITPSLPSPIGTVATAAPVVELITTITLLPHTANRRLCTRSIAWPGVAVKDGARQLQGVRDAARLRLLATWREVHGVD